MPREKDDAWANCSAVIPGPSAARSPESILPQKRMDSGLAPLARPGMTAARVPVPRLPRTRPPPAHPKYRPQGVPFPFTL